MCGKFTAQASWREVVAFSQALTESGGDGEQPGSDGGDQECHRQSRTGGSGSRFA
jgi:hypothetical protein